jgi:hypothetical protein
VKGQKRFTFARKVSRLAAKIGISPVSDLQGWMTTSAPLVIPLAAGLFLSHSKPVTGRRPAPDTLTLMPGGAHVRAAMIAHRADHAKLQLVEGGLVRQVARVEDGVVMAALVRAIDEDFYGGEGVLPLAESYEDLEAQSALFLRRAKRRIAKPGNGGRQLTASFKLRRVV